MEEHLKTFYGKSPHIGRLLCVIGGVVDAAEICESLRSPERMQVVTKADNTPLTIADVCAQAVLNRAIRKEFPDDEIVAEEDLSSLAYFQSSNNLLSILTPYGFNHEDEVCVCDAV